MRLKTKVFKDLYLSVLLDIVEEMNSPKAVAIAIALRYIQDISTVELKEILSINPDKYATPDAYMRDAQSIALLKKTNMFPIRYDKKDKLAYHAQSEQIARDMSELWRQKCMFSFEDMSCLNRASQIIYTILGAQPPEIDQWRFGPGATFHLKGIESGLQSKLRSKPEVSPMASELVYKTLNGSYYTHSYSRCDFGPPSPLPVVPGDRLALVPKDIFTPRIMCIQPLGNMCAQLGLENILRSKFYRYSGIDLTVQPEVHHDLLSEVFGTIDLSSASDSICTELVEFLLPPKWFETTDLLRCKTTVIGKLGSKSMVTKPNRKFMAQGNGFTFILETIIFYSLVRAFCETQVLQKSKLRDLISVFGDDIIVPVDCHYGACNFLERLGFRVNVNKSFGTTSQFRESCGVDVYCHNDMRTTNVRPVYFKEFSNDEGGLYLLCNSVTRVSEWFYGKCVLAGKFLRAHRRIISTLEKYSIPIYYGFRSCSEESVLWSTVYPDVRNRGGIRYIRALRNKPKRQRFTGNPYEDLAAALYGVPSQGSILRGDPIYRKARLAVNQSQSILLSVS